MAAMPSNQGSSAIDAAASMARSKSSARFSTLRMRSSAAARGRGRAPRRSGAGSPRTRRARAAGRRGSPRTPWSRRPSRRWRSSMVASRAVGDIDLVRAFLRSRPSSFSRGGPPVRSSARTRKRTVPIAWRSSSASDRARRSRRSPGRGAYRPGPGRPRSAGTFSCPMVSDRPDPATFPTSSPLRYVRSSRKEKRRRLRPRRTGAP